MQETDRLRNPGRATKAAEVATRDALERSGASHGEIDRALLIGNLQGAIFRNLVKIAAGVALAMWFFNWLEFSWTAAVVAFFLVIVLWVVAFPIAKDHATRYEWIDVGGGYVRR